MPFECGKLPDKDTSPNIFNLKKACNNHWVIEFFEKKGSLKNKFRNKYVVTKFFFLFFLTANYTAQVSTGKKSENKGEKKGKASFFFCRL